MISELKQQVNGKDGKFVKVGGGRCNKHDGGKKHKTAEKCHNHSQLSSRSSKTVENCKNQPKSNSKIQHPALNRSEREERRARESERQWSHDHGSRSRSADPHDWSDQSDSDSWGSVSRSRSRTRGYHGQERRQCRDRLRSRHQIISHCAADTGDTGDDVWHVSR